jgi:hypothetical protein
MEHQTQGHWLSLSLFFVDIEPAANNSEMYHIKYLQNVRVQTEAPRHNARDAKRSAIPGVTSHTDQDARNYRALNNALY